MAKRASKRRSWTAADVRELKSAARKKTPAGKIAKTLKRSEGATRQKAFSLGVSLIREFEIWHQVCCGKPQLRYRSKPRLVRGYLSEPPACGGYCGAPLFSRLRHEAFSTKR